MPLLFGVDFSAVDQSCEPPWADGGEGRNADVSCAAQPHIDAAMVQLSRPHMALQCVVKPPEWYGTSGMYFVNFDLACNKRALAVDADASGAAKRGRVCLPAWVRTGAEAALH